MALRYKISILPRAGLSGTLSGRALGAAACFRPLPAVQHDLYQQVVRATDGQYSVFAELGHTPERGTAYLARDLTTGSTVVLLVPPGAESLDVVTALNDAVPANGGRCAACGRELSAWVDACPHCGRSLTPPAGDSPAAAVVAAEAGETVEVVGTVPHVLGGHFFFGRDRIDRRLLAFAAHPQGDGRWWLDTLWEGDPAPPPPAPATSAVAGAAVAPPPSDADPGASFPGPAGLVFDEPAVPRGHSRRVLVAAGLAAGVVLGGAAWALARGGSSQPTVDPRSIATRARTDPAPGAGVLATLAPVGGRAAASTAQRSAKAADASTVPSADSNPRVQRVGQRRIAAERVRVGVRAADGGAVLTIEGDLPSGWMRVVNAGPASGDRAVPLAADVASVVVVEAPGYCPDTLRVTLGVGGLRHWSPVLRGRSVVGDC